MPLLQNALKPNIIGLGQPFGFTCLILSISIKFCFKQKAFKYWSCNLHQIFKSYLKILAKPNLFFCLANIDVQENLLPDTDAWNQYSKVFTYMSASNISNISHIHDLPLVSDHTHCDGIITDFGCNVAFHLYPQIPQN